LDLGLLESAGQRFVGTHDFAAFAANRGKKDESTHRTIRSVRVRKTGPCITIDVNGDGFLYKMARLMVGTMPRVALHKMDLVEVRPDRRPSFCCTGKGIVPGENLVLTLL